jgi:hypothetical protein
MVTCLTLLIFIVVDLLVFSIHILATFLVLF